MNGYSDDSVDEVVETELKAEVEETLIVVVEETETGEEMDIVQ